MRLLWLKGNRDPVFNKKLYQSCQCCGKLDTSVDVLQKGNGASDYSALWTIAHHLLSNRVQVFFDILQGFTIAQFASGCIKHFVEEFTEFLGGYAVLLRCFDYRLSRCLIDLCASNRGIEDSRHGIPGVVKTGLYSDDV